MTAVAGKKSVQFSQLHLDSRLLTALRHLGFDEATEIQQHALPLALSGRDLIASSQTGSGKTLAYLLPAMQKLLTSRALAKHGPRVVVLVPTRELARQVHTHLRPLLVGTTFKAALIVGGENFNDQAQRLRRESHIIIATPGRLADHLQQKGELLDGLELLILDEADRMLQLGFSQQIQQINQSAAYFSRQTLLFSATLDHADFENVAQALLKGPRRVALNQGHAAHTQITQHFYLCDHLDHKQALLDHLLSHESIRQAIIFTATRDDTARLAEYLQTHDIVAVALSGKLSQSQRTAIMEGFSRGRQQILVTTDVASRGLDLSSVSHVINFDLPKRAEEYVHRIGRTGRAGSSGTAISLVGPKDWRSLKRIEEFQQRPVHFEQIEGLHGGFTGSSVDMTVEPDKVSRSDKPSKAAMRGAKDRQRMLRQAGEQTGFAPLKRPTKPS